MESYAKNDTLQIQLDQALTYFLNPNTSIVYVPLHSQSTLPSIISSVKLVLKEVSKDIECF